MQTLWESTRAYTLLKADGERGRFNHAYLLLLDDARNLKNALKAFAKVLFSCDEASTPAQKRVAGLIDSESFSDCLFYPEAEKKFVVEDAERVVEECMLQPVEGSKKVFVIGDFAEATVAAQNKLLKLLEEPPRGVIFLLGATTAFPVLSTVLSRVKKAEIPPFSTEEIAACLARLYAQRYAADEYTLCAAASGGCLGSAQGMLEGGAYKTLIDDAFSLCLTPPSGLPALVKRIGETKRKKELLSLLRLVFRDALLVKTGVSGSRVFLRAEALRLSRVAERFSVRALVSAQDLIGKAERETFFNAVFPQCLETLFAGIFERA